MSDFDNEFKQDLQLTINRPPEKVEKEQQAAIPESGSGSPRLTRRGRLRSVSRRSTGGASVSRSTSRLRTRRAFGVTVRRESYGSGERQSPAVANLQALFSAIPDQEPHLNTPEEPTMSFSSFQTYENQPPGPNNRPAPSPNNMAGANGVNGNGVGLPNMMPSLPTPAGHQQDLNVINAMLEEYTKIMDNNRDITARLMDGVGRIRQRAQEKDMSNEELIDSVAKEMNDSTKNLEVECSRLRKALEIAQLGEKEYTDIAFAYAKSMGQWLEQIHAFKLKSSEDAALWHRSYRDQLEVERAENLRLRLQIDDMNASAARAKKALNKFEAEWNGTPKYYELLAETVKHRQLARTWKRMALPYLPDDDPEFSDDDDMIDPTEKKRVALENIERIRSRDENKAAQDVAAHAVDGNSLAAGMANIQC